MFWSHGCHVSFHPKICRCWLVAHVSKSLIRWSRTRSPRKEKVHGNHPNLAINSVDRHEHYNLLNKWNYTNLRNLFFTRINNQPHDPSKSMGMATFLKKRAQSGISPPLNLPPCRNFLCISLSSRLISSKRSVRCYTATLSTPRWSPRAFRKKQ